MADWKREIRQQLANLNLEPAREAEIVEELSQHLEDRYAELLSCGAPPAEAYQQALAELSGAELLARELQQVERQVASEPIALGANRRTNVIADFWQDLRYGVRMLRKTPEFTAVAALALALGIGVNTTILSIVNGFTLRPLPVEKPDELITLFGKVRKMARSGAPLLMRTMSICAIRTGLYPDCWRCKIHRRASAAARATIPAMAAAQR